MGCHISRQHSTFDRVRSDEILNIAHMPQSSAMATSMPKAVLTSAPAQVTPHTGPTSPVSPTSMESPTSIVSPTSTVVFDGNANAFEGKTEPTATAYSIANSSEARFAPTASVPNLSDKSSPVRSLLKRFLPNHEPVWRPSLLKPRPLAGLVALALSVACMLASLAILLVSNNQPISSWPVQPTVYLAIAAAIANVAIGFARLVAGPISWYHSASRGNSIRDLERQWEASHSVALAIKRKHSPEYILLGV